MAWPPRGGKNAFGPFGQPPQIYEANLDSGASGLVIRGGEIELAAAIWRRSLKSKEKLMRFFTPQLLERIASADDEVSAAAHDDWERAIERSDRRWQKIKDLFPAAVRRFDESGLCLHDAELLSMGQQRGTLVIALKLEAPAQSLVVLTFKLLGDPVIDQTALAADGKDGPVTWLYEEWDVDRRNRCWLEVLLSNGWSVKLCFRGFQFVYVPELLRSTA